YSDRKMEDRTGVNNRRTVLLALMPAAAFLAAGFRLQDKPSIHSPFHEHHQRRPDDSPLPEYITGDECLFCHRFQTGQHWQENRHNRTIRRIENDEELWGLIRRESRTNAHADSIEFAMGGKNRIRFLKKGQG